jgi:hypothetical protein
LIVRFPFIMVATSTIVQSCRIDHPSGCSQSPSNVEAPFAIYAVGKIIALVAAIHPWFLVSIAQDPRSVPLRSKDIWRVLQRGCIPMFNIRSAHAVAVAGHRQDVLEFFVMEQVHMQAVVMYTRP